MTEIRIGDIIQAIVYFIPVATLIWKMSGIVSQVNVNTKDIDGIGTRIGKSTERSEKKLEEMSMKLDELHHQMIALKFLTKKGKK